MAIPVAIGKSKIFSFKTLVNITDAGKKQNKTKTILAKFLFFFSFLFWKIKLDIES